MFEYLISEDDRSPKYRQLTASVKRLVLSGAVPPDSPLPSINKLCKDYGISRDTVIKAYDELEREGFIKASHGKGFFTATLIPETSFSSFRVLMLMDSMSMFKEKIYQSLLASLGADSHVDMLFHQCRRDLVTTLLKQYGNAYDCIGLVPPDGHCGEEILALIHSMSRGGRRFFLLDRADNECELPGVFQDFKGSFIEALSGVVEELRQYRKISLILPESDNHIIKELEEGFVLFCSKYKLNGARLTSSPLPEKASVYIAVSDFDLAALIKAGNEASLQPGSDYALISYNDTVLKELIAGGLSVISTDFAEIGERFAAFIKGKETGRTVIPARLIRRLSF